MKAKPLIQSRTFWFNILFGVVAVASLFGFSEFQPDANVAELVGVVVAVINIGLRLKTGAPIKGIK